MFFADGVQQSAAGAVSTARRLVELGQQDREKIASLGRVASTALRVHLALHERPVSNAAQLVNKTGLSTPTVLKGLTALESLGIAKELTGRRRNRVFSYAPYIRILSEGTEPL